MKLLPWSRYYLYTRLQAPEILGRVQNGFENKAYMAEKEMPEPFGELYFSNNLDSHIEPNYFEFTLPGHTPKVAWIKPVVKGYLEKDPVNGGTFIDLRLSLNTTSMLVLAGTYTFLLVFLLLMLRQGSYTLTEDIWGIVAVLVFSLLVIAFITRRYSIWDKAALSFSRELFEAELHNK